MSTSHQIADGHGRFGLTEAFHDLQAGRFLELVIHLRIQGLTGGRHVYDRRKIILGQIFLDQHTKDGRRSTERGDLVFGEHRKDLRRIESVKVIGEDSSFTEPLAIELAPEGFSPAGLRDRKMQSLVADSVPVSRRDIMPQRIGIGVSGDLGISGSA